MLGLNQDYPLILSTVLEHAAVNFADVPVVSFSHGEETRTDYRSTAARASSRLCVGRAGSKRATGLP